MLAFHMPKPYEKENVKEYTSEDLLAPKIVEELFDYSITVTYAVGRTVVIAIVLFFL